MSSKKSGVAPLPVIRPYSLRECVQNHYSEPCLWDEMIRIHKRE